VARLERAWSRFLPGSELRRAELAAAGRWTPISPTLALALDRALLLAAGTGGLFDPTVGASLDAIGYDRPFHLVATDDRAAVRPVAAPGPTAIELDPDGPALRLRPGTQLDLGGVGKGLAADLLVAGARSRGATSACIGIGGDVRVGGATPVGGWPVPLADPAGGPARCVTLRDGALVTSTTSVRAWQRGGRRVHHLVDPRSGAPAATGIRAVIARADEAWWAEGVAKAALVAGRVEGRLVLSHCGVAGWFVDADGAWTVAA
jgi:thiamine biosynthesis lipoprotein